MRIIICAVVVISAGCRAAGHDQAPSAVGCYHIDAGIHSSYMEYQQPALAYLDSMEVGEVGSRTYRLSEIPGSLPSIHRIAYWRMVGPDTLEMVWSTGFDGVILRVPSLAADTLRGRSIAWNDASPADTFAALVVRIPCDISIAPEFARRRPAPPSVQLVRGEPLQLGTTFNPITADTLGAGRRFLVRDQVAGVFADADSVVVTTDRQGLTRAIILAYSDDSSLLRSLTFLRRRYGPSFSERGGDTSTGAWIDRELLIQVTPRQGSRYGRVLIADPKR